SEREAIKTAPASPTQPAGNHIGEDKAKEKALAHAKVTADKATALRVELDRDDGRTVYEVEFRADGYEYEYEIDATTGDVLKYDRERED
ncbi:MAG: PepSY domain-containing protein, partial [Clostridia bacterium]|nr:PepSY domain-containing protein [Clostridia bacterium]